MHIYFNSQNEYYKSPFGAMPTREKAEFKISIYDDLPPRSVKLRIWRNDHAEFYDMRQFNVSVGEGEHIFTTDYTMPDEPCLVWYYFVVENGQGTFYYGNNLQNLGGEGEMSDCPPRHSYQITVYDKKFTTPEWFRRGVMYQIFVDRFYNGNDDKSICKKRDEYVIHNDWYEPISFNMHPYENGLAANDFYGGNLLGIIKKLPYLADLGVSVLYLNPVFEAYSNHKYDTADYKNIDSMFGDNEIFKELCEKAEEMGIKIILDGVFSHTGADSIYFNKYSTYSEDVGAYRSEDSPYREWYKFDKNNNYESWWGCTTLPNVTEMEPSYLDYILCDDDAVITKWLGMGASGWRLDVADELPDEFIKIMRSEIKSKFPEAVIIGEVWEDASNKVSYGQQREYLLGNELDSVMNYVFKDNLISFILGRQTAADFNKNLMKIFENYPAPVLYALMNLVGGHDVARIKTVMGEMYDDPNVLKQDKQHWRLSAQAETLAILRVKLAALIQMTFVGVPCIYYGDEIGMQGLSDPLNRMPYTWRCVDEEIREWYKKLIRIRNSNEVFQTGKYKTVYANEGVFAFVRYTEKKAILSIINREEQERYIRADLARFGATQLVSMLDDKVLHANNDGTVDIRLSALNGNVFEIN